MTTDALLQQAIAHHQAGQLQEAGAIYRRILETEPAHPVANHNLGALAVQTGRPADALPYFVAAIEADPSRAQYWVSYIDALFQDGQQETAREVLALARQQGLEGAEVDALASRMAGNGQPEAQELQAMVALFNAGKLTEAATLAQAMTARFPQHGFAWKLLGAIFMQMGWHEDALSAMQKAAALSAHDAEAHANLGFILKELGRLDEANASCRQALALKPDDAAARATLKDTLRLQGLPPDYLAPEIFDAANGRVLKRYFPLESDCFVYVIDVTGTCNLRCPSCPVGNFRDANRPKGFMELELFRGIIEKICREHVADKPNIWLFNWGEPLLHPRLPEMIAILRQHGLYSLLSSNLNIKTGLEEAIRSGPDELKISLSGFTQEPYSLTHAKGKIELVKQNMALIREYLDKYQGSTKVWVGLHVYRHNRHELAAIEQLCQSLGFGFSAVQAFYQPIEKMMALVEGKETPADSQFLANFIEHPLTMLANKRQAIDPSLDCELRFNMTTINYDGSVALCCGVYDYQNMLGVNFMDAAHEDIQALKYKNPFCKKCYDYGLQYSRLQPA